MDVGAHCRDAKFCVSTENGVAVGLRLFLFMFMFMFMFVFLAHYGTCPVSNLLRCFQYILGCGSFRFYCV